MGAWYLLTLFSYRLVLPEVKRIRGILIVGALISIFACLGSFDGDFAIKKTLGFFVYFVAGYKFSDLPRKLIPSWLARGGVAITAVLFFAISYKTDWYADVLSVLSRGADIDSFSHWYLAPLYYAGALISAIAVIFLVLHAVPEKCAWLEKQGTDTMPMYLSHLILFMAVGYLVNKNNWILTVVVSVLGILASLAIFSSGWYRKVFNRLIGGVKKALLRED